jgi:protein-disulfide isomerase
MEVYVNNTKSKREILREKRKEQKRRRTITVIIIVGVAVILFSFAALLPKLIMGKVKYKNALGFSVGDPDAPVTVTEFSSYSCGYCKNFSESYESDFIAKYVDTGLVYFTYINLPSGSEESLAAAEASYCAAEQDLFFEYKEFLFTYSGSENGFSENNLITYASSAGLNVSDFQVCMDSDIYANAYLDDYQYATDAGLTGTPSFLINGTSLVLSSQLDDTVDAYLGN